MEKIDIKKEKAAIIAVIEEETEAFFDSDINRLGALHVQDETNIRLQPLNQVILMMLDGKKLTGNGNLYFILQFIPQPGTTKKKIKQKKLRRAK